MTNKTQYRACKYLPDEIKKEMKADVLESFKDKLERGFRICSSTEKFEEMDNKNTIMLEKCVGTERCMSITGDCPPGMKKISYFHTHPKSLLTYPSLVDIMHSEIHNYNFLCIGGKENNKPIVRCMPIDVPILSPQSHRIELDWFIKKWKKEVEDCII